MILNMHPIINKLTTIMPNVDAITFDLKTVVAILVATLALFTNFFQEISFISTGSDRDEEIKQEIRALKTTIDAEHQKIFSEHKSLYQRFESFKERDATKDTQTAIELGRYATESKYLKNDVDKLVLLVETLDNKFDDFVEENYKNSNGHTHKFIP